MKFISYSELKNSFSLEEYKLILKMFRKENYNFVSFHEFKPNKKNQVIIRHDIDFEPSLKFAYIEDALKISSTYHFLIVAHYNFHENRIKKIVKELKTLGHQIGYHHDQTGRLFSDYDLFIFFDTEVDSYSFHRPKTYKIEKQKFKIPFAYSKIIKDNSIYLSDSNCKWKNGHPFDIIPESNGSNIQMITHPIWWTPRNEFTDRIRSDYDLYRALNIKRIAEKERKLTIKSILSQIKDSENLDKIIKVRID